MTDKKTMLLIYNVILLKTLEVRLIQSNIPVDIIMHVTGLSREELLKLAK